MKLMKQNQGKARCGKALVALFLISLLLTAGKNERTAAKEDFGPVQEDFLEWYQINPDLVGWLLVDDVISAPVMQLDNDYYLHHDFYRQENDQGTLFVNEYNNLWPPDPLILIHGHNMRDGSMFGKLTAYADLSYLKEHPVLIFRTIRDDSDVYYTPAAAFHLSTEGTSEGFFDVPWLLYDDPAPEDSEEERASESEIQTGSSEDETVSESETQADGSEEAGDPEMRSERYRKRFKIYMEVVMERTCWFPKIDVEPEDDLLALITCSYHYENGRFVLLCRKLRDRETIQDIWLLYHNDDGIIEEPE